MSDCAVFALLALLALPSALAAGGGAPAPERPVHLFILSGQSNMAGLDPAKSFTPAVEKALPGAEVLVVKDAESGQPIRRWYKKWKPARGEAPPRAGDLYDRLMTRVKKAAAGKKPATVTFVWMQGERDAREKHGEVYAESLAGLIAQFRQDLARQDVDVVVGRLSDFDNENKQYPHWTMVREAQVKVAEADPRGAWVDTDDLNGPRNDLHYTREGYEKLGERFAAKALELLRKGQAPAEPPAGGEQPAGGPPAGNPPAGAGGGGGE